MAIPSTLLIWLVANRKDSKTAIDLSYLLCNTLGPAGGEPAKNVTYRARVRVTAKASEEQIRAPMEHTDKVAEIQNTLRVLTPVALGDIEAVCV
jgi:hypothetical protein